MDVLAVKIEKVKVLDIKLQQSEKQVKDLLSERVLCEVASLVLMSCYRISLRPMII